VEQIKRPDTGRTRIVPLFFTLGNFRFGLEVNNISFVSGERQGLLYLTQFILHLGLFCIRLHRFNEGDDKRALHDHPFWFITFPLSSYFEIYWDAERGHECIRKVRAGRFHFRPARHRHRVALVDKPFWTVVIAGRYTRPWGFWPDENTFIHAECWETYCRRHGL
jgi:hypothetical protein